MPDSHPPLPRGFRAAGIACGIRARSRLDLGLLVADEAYPAYGMFTRNKLLGAHVPVCRKHLAQSRGRVRAILVNSGNANCATGTKGEQDNVAVARELARLLACPVHEVLFLSTGVIGKALPTETILGALPELLAQADDQGVENFARAIMTTDTVPKTAGATVGEARVCGIAKGSGMIHPDMATMLAFLLTDGSSTASLDIGMRAIADETFHCVTVDGDTSPNDTFILWTADRILCPAEPREGDAGPPHYPLEAALTAAGQDLARQIAADGEGATRLVTLRITGAASGPEALDAGRFIATSPLVKTAICGRDPNWGRILSAAANSEVAIDIERATIRIGGHPVFADNAPQPQNEPAAAAHMNQEREVLIEVDLASGPFETTVWTCDLTADYVRINADYRS